LPDLDVVFEAALLGAPSPCGVGRGGEAEVQPVATVDVRVGEEALEDVARPDVLQVPGRLGAERAGDLVAEAEL